MNRCPQVSDEDDLARELGWIEPNAQRDRRIFKTRPAGVNAMDAMAGVIWLVSGGLALASVGRVTGAGPVAAAFLVAALLAFLAVYLSRRIWVAMGSTLRSIVRPLGILGPLPLIGILVVGGGMVAVVLTGGHKLPPRTAASASRPAQAAKRPASPPLPPSPPPKPRSLAVVVQVHKPAVVGACTTRGAGWVMASDQELLRTQEAINFGQQKGVDLKYIWTRYGPELYARPLNCGRTSCSIDGKTTHSGAAAVLCALEETK